MRAATGCLPGRTGAVWERPWRPKAGARSRRAPCSPQASLLQLPILALPSPALHPTGQRRVRIFEPQYLALFEHLLMSYPSGAGAVFLHCPHPSSAPPALFSEAGTVGGLPAVGCAAEVKSIWRTPGGELMVEYVGSRRARLLLLHQDEPFKVAAAEWYDDWTVSESETPLDQLEQELMVLLRQVCELSAALDPQLGGAVGLLPEAVQRYAPPGPRQLTSYDTLRVSAPRAAAAIDMWRRHGSVYDSGPAQGRRRHSDPYQVVREELGAGQRRELFSFAAAQMLDLGPPEALALLLSRDTGARLQWVAQAVRPHLQELRAKAAVKGALEGGSL